MKLLSRWYGRRAVQQGFDLMCDSRKIEGMPAHCLCCAYAEAIGKYGGDCDLRGLHVYGRCYDHLFIMVRVTRSSDV